MELSHLAILLLFVGLALIIAEVFIPSGGVITAGAVIALAAAMVCAWNAWWGSSPGAWWSFVAAGLFLIPAVLLGALWALPHTSLGRRFLLEAPTPEELHAYGDVDQRLASLVGARGVSLTLLNPGGLVQVEGERLHGKSEGMLIDAGHPVKVVAIAGNLVVVRPVSAESSVPAEDVSTMDDFLSAADETGDAAAREDTI